LTTVLRDPRQDGRSEAESAVPGPGSKPARLRTAWWPKGPAWPIVALLAWWPLWWVLGIADYVIVLLAIPMIRQMYRWRVTRERTIRMPPGFTLWILFLVITLFSVATLSQTAPDTLVSPTSHRLISWVLRTADYGGVTVLLLYAGNLTERELPRRNLAWLLGLVGIYSVIGGLAGIADPRLQLTSPLSVLVPQSLAATNGNLTQMMHPSLSEVQGFLGYAEARPKAPFDYTNNWGNALVITLPWLVVAWWSYGRRKERWAVLCVVGLALVPILYSLNRGVWVAIGCTILYLAVRLAIRGKFAMLGVVGGVVLIGVLVILATPVQSLISQRLAHGQSNSGRLGLSYIATRDALASPIVGYGDTRHQVGSGQSIAIGRTANCLRCGNSTVGGNGQLWLLLITTGFAGTLCFVGFFAYGVWRYWRDLTPYGIVGVLVLMLSFVFMIVYDSDGPTLYFIMLGYALLWRNDRERQHPARNACPVRSAGRFPAADRASRHHGRRDLVMPRWPGTARTWQNLP
jgi:hypothetical protein